MIDDVLNEFQTRAHDTVDALRRELSRMRTGRANLSILEGIKVDYYGQSTPLNGVAALSVPEPRLITIKPWDKSMIQPIEKAVFEANLGLNPVSDGELIRLPIPPLTEERRKEMVKQVKQKGEEHKVTVRNARRDSKDMLEEGQKEGEITEDDLKRALDRLQKATDDGVKKIDDVVAAKEEELLQV
jgi:ribosome recycling factor